MGGNPLKWIDPLGLSETMYQTIGGATFTLNNPTATEFIKFVSSIPDNSLTYFRQFGHGNVYGICISKGKGCRSDITDSGNIMFQDDEGNFKNLGNLIELLSSKWYNDAGTFEFSGCNVASGEDNIAKDFSKKMPNVTIKGGYWYQWGFETDNYGNSGWSIGLKRYYKNGLLQ